MKKLLGILLAAAILIGGTALAVQLGDRGTFVSPPDAMAEGFVREIVTKRWDRARAYLLEPDSVSDAELAALEKSWEAQAGDPSSIEAETITQDYSQALVTVRMRSGRGSEAVAIVLQFDDDWKVVHTPAVGIPIH